jgi:5-methylcytosine-specific restriction endonuclease McrA
MWRRNSKIVRSTQSECGICDLYVDHSKPTYHDLSAVVDHIMPLKKGGHLFDLKNLQLAHWYCNGKKSDRLQSEISALEKRQMQLHIIQLTSTVTPSGIDWSSLVENGENDWLDGDENDES